jgi:O-antigen/teichoic acid export membrane protein
VSAPTAVARRSIAGEGRRVSLLSSASLLTVAMVASGLLAYVFQILAARALDPEAFGQIAVLWGATFLVSIVLFRPLEQTLARALADRAAREREVWTVLRSTLILYAALLVAAGAAFVATEPLISRRLFASDSTMTITLGVAVACYGLAYVVRGVAAGAHWFRGYGIALLADGLVRVLAALPIVVVASKHLAGFAIAAAALAGALVPLWAGRGLLPGLRTGAARDDRFRLASALSFAAPASIVAGCDQLLVNGAPLLVMIEGGPGANRAAGLVFAATMLVRVPVFVYQGLAASLLPNLTRMYAQSLPGVRRAVAGTAGILLTVGLAIVAVSVAAGPTALRALFGAQYGASRLDLGLLAAGVGFYLAAATISQSLLALDRGRRAAAGWLASAALLVVVYHVLPGSELGRVSAAFAAATLTGLLALVAVASVVAPRWRERGAG